MDNLNIMSDDKLEDMLESLSEDSPAYKLIDDELNARMTLRNKAIQAAQAVRAAKVSKFTALIVQAYGGEMGKLVAAYGDEFIDDYSIDSQFTVTSHVAMSHQEDKYHCQSLSDAENRVALSIYYRAYNKYVR